MTENNRILQRAIKKAVKNGYEIKGDLSLEDIMEVLDKNTNVAPAVYYWLIFNRDFAKAFWGEDEVDDRGRDFDEAWEEYWEDTEIYLYKEEFELDFGFDIDTQPAWEYHLQQMVLRKNKLRYIEKFL